jgi:hypothetical protein
MSAIITNTKTAAIEYRMAIFWFVLFSLNSLGTSILASLTGANWAELDGQSKFMIVMAVLVNWTGTIMAFISKQSARIKQTGEILPSNDTQQIIKTP